MKRQVADHGESIHKAYMYKGLIFRFYKEHHSIKGQQSNKKWDKRKKNKAHQKVLMKTKTIS